MGLDKNKNCTISSGVISHFFFVLFLDDDGVAAGSETLTWQE
jgi:hypothetical protein